MDRRDHFDFLAAKMAAFAGVRIESQHRDPAARASEKCRSRSMLTMRSVDIRRSRVMAARNIGKRQMRGHQSHSQLIADQQHDRQRRAGSHARDIRCVR